MLHQDRGLAPGFHGSAALLGSDEVEWTCFCSEPLLRNDIGKRTKGSLRDDKRIRRVQTIRNSLTATFSDLFLSSFLFHSESISHRSGFPRCGVWSLLILLLLRLWLLLLISVLLLVVLRQAHPCSSRGRVVLRSAFFYSSWWLIEILTINIRTTNELELRRLRMNQ